MIAAEGEHKASRALRMAAEVIMDSPAALQVGFDQDEVMMMVMMIVDSFAALQAGSFIFSSYNSITSYFFCPAALSSNLEQHCGREQQHDHLPHPD